MTLVSICFVVLAAAFHAGWNALAKRARDPFLFLWLASVVATASLAPFLWLAYQQNALVVEGLRLALVTIFIHGLYFYSLGRSYRTGDYSLVYPISRGLGVTLVPVIAWLTLGETLSYGGIAGIVLVVIGILAVGLQPAAGRGSAQIGRGAGWALFTGLTVACYSVVDKAAVLFIHPVPYAALLWIGTAVVLIPVVIGKRREVLVEWKTNWKTIVIASYTSVAAYGIVLFVFQTSKTGYVVATREVSIVLSILIGSLVLKEGRLGPRLIGGLLITIGVVFIALLG